jgi:hypothetical protein
MGELPTAATGQEPPKTGGTISKISIGIQWDAWGWWDTASY